MLIKLPIAWIIVLNVAGWPIIQLGFAWLFTQLPVKWFASATPPPKDRTVRFYERVCAIKRWKDRLPDGARFSHGFAKGSLTGLDRPYLDRFIAETWRGELCHWFALACAPLFFLWNPVWADIVMVGYALLANLPCILAQRYNRLRLSRLLARRF